MSVFDVLQTVNDDDDEEIIKNFAELKIGKQASKTKKDKKKEKGLKKLANRVEDEEYFCAAERESDCNKCTRKFTKMPHGPSRCRALCVVTHERCKRLAEEGLYWCKQHRIHCSQLHAAYHHECTERLKSPPYIFLPQWIDDVGGGDDYRLIRTANERELDLEIINLIRSQPEYSNKESRAKWLTNLRTVVGNCHAKKQESTKHCFAIDAEFVRAHEAYTNALGKVHRSLLRVSDKLLK